jgi:hypothetical protein
MPAIDDVKEALRQARGIRSAFTVKQAWLGTESQTGSGSYTRREEAGMAFSLKIRRRI